MSRPRPCPCGASLSYADHCGPLHRGDAVAASAEDLMRSRYSAFVLGETTYLLDTWHSSTRPRKLTLDLDVRWTGLEIAFAQGGPFDTKGTVEFRASHVGGVQHERSSFLREGGRWYYVE